MFNGNNVNYYVIEAKQVLLPVINGRKVFNSFHVITGTEYILVMQSVKKNKIAKINPSMNKAKTVIQGRP